jgi:hypothetical protein
MARRPLAYFIVSFAALAWFRASDSQAASPSGLLTAREQGLVLQSTGMAGEGAATSRNQLLSDLDKTIRRANLGKDSQTLRRPVSEATLRNLQLRSAMRGNFLSRQELRAATDYAHALLLESNGKVSLAEKVGKLPEQLRKPFHGKVAELAEARARGMVLNKNARGPTWDLTEAKFQPRNYQMKIYAQHDRALASVLDDLDKRLEFNKRGILPKATLEHGVHNGRLVRSGNVYRPVGRTDVELHPSKVFSRPPDSHLYAKSGRESLIKRGLPGGKPASVATQTAGKWLGRAGGIALVATQVYVIHGFATGQLSEREFATAQSAIAGGAVGGWAGATGGAAAGAAIGVWFGGVGAGPGALIGGIIGGIAGGFGGAKLAEMAASGFYGRLDQEQKQQVAAYIYQHYGASR